MGIYIINEIAARRAHEMNSMSAYKEGRATKDYQYLVENAEGIAERQKESHPDEAERIEYLLELYKKKLCEWMNESFRIEAMCPSILVSGAGNFPTRKKDKQNSRRQTHFKERDRIDGILYRIQRIGTYGIKSGDAKAIEKLEQKVELLEMQRDRMKEINAYYRKHKTLAGFESLSKTDAKNIMSRMEKSFYPDKPYAQYELTNIGTEIRRLKKRIEELIAMKESGKIETDTAIEGLKIVENPDIARIQLIFEDKPTETARGILKSYGFRWAPSLGAWQRNLNANSKRAAQRVVEELSKI